MANKKNRVNSTLPLPIGTMYGIYLYTYIYHKKNNLNVNVGK